MRRTVRPPAGIDTVLRAAPEALSPPRAGLTLGPRTPFRQRELLQLLRAHQFRQRCLHDVAEIMRNDSIPAPEPPDETQLRDFYDMVVLTGMGKMGYVISRLAPKLYERIMTYQFKQELNEQIT